MKFSSTIAAAALATAVTANTFADVPKCGQSCMLTTIESTGCGVTDYKCICAHNQFIGSIGHCFAEACYNEDTNKAMQAAAALCKNVGISIPTTIPDDNESSEPDSNESAAHAGSYDSYDSYDSPPAVHSAQTSSVPSYASSVPSHASSAHGSSEAPAATFTPEASPAPSSSEAPATISEAQDTTSEAPATTSEASATVSTSPAGLRGNAPVPMLSSSTAPDSSEVTTPTDTYEAPTSTGSTEASSPDSSPETSSVRSYENSPAGPSKASNAMYTSETSPVTDSSVTPSPTDADENSYERPASADASSSSPASTDASSYTPYEATPAISAAPYETETPVYGEAPVYETRSNSSYIPTYAPISANTTLIQSATSISGYNSTRSTYMPPAHSGAGTLAVSTLLAAFGAVAAFFL